MLKLAATLASIACIAASPLFPELRLRPTTMPADAPAPQPLAADDVKAWETQRSQIRRAWERILGPMPPRVPLDVRVVAREELDDHSRLLLRYRNDAASTNDAYLLIPKHLGAAKRPGVVCFHPTSKTHISNPVGLAGREAVHHALHLVRRDYVCIAPRNYLWAVEGRGWKQSAADVMEQGPYTTGMAKMLFDAMRAIDVLVERPEVDAARLGAIGHSLGGKEALYLAAFDQRIDAAISCEGGVGLPLSNWHDEHYLGEQIRAPGFRHDNHEILALIAPRAILVIGGESADGARSWPYVEAALRIFRLYDAEDRLGLLRHAEKHNFPSPGPQRDLAYRWLDHWMRMP